MPLEPQPNLPPDVSQMTEAQQRAVQFRDGDLHITGGPGSGKTAVLARHVEHLLSTGHVEPERIVVFGSSPTAAHSLKATLAALLPELGDRIRVSTLKAICAQILRRYGSLSGLDVFSIYDDTTAQAVVDEELTAHGYGPESEGPEQVFREIARMKDQPQSVGPMSEPLHCGTELFEEIYPAYQVALGRARAFDGSDLILKTRHLFEENEALLGQYRSHWLAFHIDDAHNWTFNERSLLNLLAGASSRLVITSDEKQRLRGSPNEPSGAAGLWADRPERKHIELRPSFRPPGPIAALATSFSCGLNVPGAGGATDPGDGKASEATAARGENGRSVPQDQTTTVLLETASAEKERRAIAQRIEWLCDGDGFTHNDIAVLARRADELLPLAEDLDAAGIPAAVEPKYRLQDETHDLLAYLQVVANPHDDRRLLRIVNQPSRGVGPKTKERVRTFAREEETSIWEALHRLDEIDSLTGAPRKALRTFRNGMAPFVERAQNAPPSEWARELVEESGFLQSVTRGKTREHLSRRENVERLLKQLESEEGPHASVHSILDRAWLAGPPVASNEHVRLLPVHEAGGLEMPVVFLLGLEEGLFPRAAATNQAPLLEQERRAFHVGLTRAQERLFLSWAKSREDVTEEPCARSRFLDELDPDCYAVEPASPPASDSALPNLADSYKNLDPHYYRDNLRTRQKGERAAPTPTEEEADRIREGLRVEHKKMGKGTVLDTEGEGEKRIALVRFEERGEKKINLRYAPLTIIGEAETD